MVGRIVGLLWTKDPIDAFQDIVKLRVGFSGVMGWNVFKIIWES